MNTPSAIQTPDLKPKWRERFAFFDAYGAPSSPEFRAAFKALPRGKKRLVNMNFFGFFFGPFYFFALGLWKKALSFIALALGLGVLEVLFTMFTGIDIPHAVDTGLSVGFAMMIGISTNYAYYLKVVKGSQGWNPLEGMRAF